MAAGVTEKIIEFDIPDRPLNMNDSDGSPAARRATHAKKDAWREATYFAACEAWPGLGPSGRGMPPCDVYVSIPVAGNVRRDPMNWFATVKVIVDALVTAEVFADDSREYVTTHEPALRVVSKGDLMKSKVIVRLVPR